VCDSDSDVPINTKVETKKRKSSRFDQSSPFQHTLYSSWVLSELQLGQRW
jgi:hypothetical protein